MKDLRKFGRYEIREHLGSGAFAQVYRAWDPDESREVVLKVLSNELGGRSLERFLAETRILSGLHHPNIVKVFEVGTQDGSHYYSMEYVRAETLQVLLERRRAANLVPPFDTPEILSIVSDVAEALAYTHERRILHRDVKPANILVDADSRATLMDFGVAKSAAHSLHTETGALLGTPLYMSPEQLQGRDVDALSDLYSLGLVAFELATGELPLASENPYTSATRRLTEPIPPPSAICPSVDPVLDKIISKCLETARDRRFQSCRKLLDALYSHPSHPNIPKAHRAANATVDDSQGPVSTISRRDDIEHGDPGIAGRMPDKLMQDKTATAAGLALLGLLCLFTVLAAALVAPKKLDFRYGGLLVETSADSVAISLDTTPELKCDLFLTSADSGKERRMTVSDTFRSHHHGEFPGLEPGGSYTYRLRFIDRQGHSVFSPPGEFTLPSGGSTARAAEQDGLSR